MTRAEVTFWAVGVFTGAGLTLGILWTLGLVE